MKLSEYAKQKGVSYRTAWRWYKEGLIDGTSLTPTGMIIIPEQDACEKGRTIVYCRVSSSMNKANLETQSKRVCSFCAAKGWTVSDVVKEIGSGLNDGRKKLNSILSDKTVTRIVVEHKDRLTRFGFNYIKTLFDGEIVVINEATEDRDDLMGDFVSVITSFCARLYGLRRNRRRTEKLIAELTKEKKHD